MIADDHDLLRAGIRDVVRYGGWTICAEVNNGRDAVSQAIETKPDIVIIDLVMPDLNGIEAIEKILSALPATKIMSLTLNHSEILMRSAIEAGTHGYAFKSDPEEVILQGIRTVLSGNTFFTPAIAQTVLHSLKHDSPMRKGRDRSIPSRLAPRELELLQLLAEGKTSKEAAAIFGTSYLTVETQRKNLMRKLEFRSIADLVRYAIRNQLVEV